MAKKKSNKEQSLKPIERLAKSLFEDTEKQSLFIDSIVNPKPKATALIWFTEKQQLGIEELKIPDSFPEWISLVATESEIGKSSEHQKGDFYCLDPSSVFAMLQIVSLVESRQLGSESVVVDLCSSPGGKTMFTARAVNPAQIICNEVSGSRIPALLSNLKRCKLKQAIVTQADPAHFSNTNREVADLVLVDAPCSGQSLLAKSERGLGCFSKPVINANVGRQRRILAEASKIVRAGGFILYSTCTFSHEENEKNIQWFLKKFPAFQQLDSGRMWPQDGLGAGSFFSLLKDLRSPQPVNPIDLTAVKHWQLYFNNTG